MFSLVKLAYFACDEESRHWYNTKPKGAIKVDLKSCCICLLTYNEGNNDLFSLEIVNDAAKFGHLDCLMRCKRKELPWLKSLSNFIAMNDDIDCLIYTFRNKCMWTTKTCMEAARHGHLDCLKYLRENECPWDYTTILYAARSNQKECLKYALSNGCPSSNDMLHLARMRLLLEHGATIEEVNALGL